MPPAPMGATISYGPRRVPGPRDMDCQEDGAIVADLLERFCDPDADQSAPWNTNVRGRVCRLSQVECCRSHPHGHPCRKGLFDWQWAERRKARAKVVVVKFENSVVSQSD